MLTPVHERPCWVIDYERERNSELGEGHPHYATADAARTALDQERADARQRLTEAEQNLARTGGLHVPGRPGPGWDEDHRDEHADEVAQVTAWDEARVEQADDAPCVEVTCDGDCGSALDLEYTHHMRTLVEQTLRDYDWTTGPLDDRQHYCQDCKPPECEGCYAHATMAHLYEHTTWCADCWDSDADAREDAETEQERRFDCPEPSAPAYDDEREALTAIDRMLAVRRMRQQAPGALTATVCGCRSWHVHDHARL